MVDALAPPPTPPRPPSLPPLPPLSARPIQATVVVTAPSSSSLPPSLPPSSSSSASSSSSFFIPSLAIAAFTRGRWREGGREEGRVVDDYQLPTALYDP